jgi:hypothetical protein
LLLAKEKSFEAGEATSWYGCIDHKLELVTKLAFKDVPESAHHGCLLFYSISTLFLRPQRN